MTLGRSTGPVSLPQGEGRAEGPIGIFSSAQVFRLNLPSEKQACQSLTLFLGIAAVVVQSDTLTGVGQSHGRLQMMTDYLVTLAVRDFVLVVMCLEPRELMCRAMN